MEVTHAVWPVLDCIRIFRSHCDECGSTVWPVLDCIRIFRSYCDECGSAVWPVLQTIYECKTCSHIVHAQCLAR